MHTNSLLKLTQRPLPREARFWRRALLRRVVFCLQVVVLCASGVCLAIDDLGPVHIEGDIEGSKDISALGLVGDYLVIGSDETNAVQILKATTGNYKVKHRVFLSQRGNTTEIDIEGIAVEGNTVYVIGSHAKVRPRVKRSDNYRKNRERLEQAPKQDDEFRSRNTVARFSVDSNGKVSTPQFTSLTDILDNTMPFKLFRPMPSKENGIDIEGLAVKDGVLYAGFRGPVLRGNYVPVLVFGFDHPRQQMEVRYLNLCGRGVRDLARVDSGFLVLAGPLGDGPGSYQIYHWDGSDMVPGADHPAQAALRLLAELPITDDPSAKAEGMVVVSTQANTYELLIAFDGIKDGGMRRYRLADAAANPGQLCEAD